MDQVHVVRHKVLVEGRSQRAVSRELGLARVTVRKYLDQAAAVRKPEVVRRRPVWELVASRFESLLAESAQWTGGKQQLTATRLQELLVGEGHQVGVTLVKAAVAEWKRQRREVFVPLMYRPGDLAEVDFFEVLVDIDGTRRKAWLFLMRLMYSGRDFAWIYERQDQISFLDGHVRALAHFGGVPTRIAYDYVTRHIIEVLCPLALCGLPRCVAKKSRRGARRWPHNVSKRRQPRQQPGVIVPNGAWGAGLIAAHGWLTELDGRLLHARVDFSIAIRRVQADVAEPAANHIYVDPGLKQMDRRRMPEDVRARRSVRSRGRGCAGCARQSAHDLVDPEARQRPPVV
jgi:transposase